MDSSIKSSPKYLADVFKLVMAIFVVAIHSQLANGFDGILGLILKNLFAVAVPFFFIASGYFLFRRFDINNFDIDYVYIKKYLSKILKMYVVWSFIYLPLTIYGEISYGTNIFKAVVKVFKNYILVGENFYSWQLWYLLGLIVALFIIYMLIKAKINYKAILLISFTVFLLGIAIDILNKSQIAHLPVSIYYVVFNTTRNGIFLGFFYVAIGMYISQCNEKLSLWDILIIVIAIAALFSADFKRVSVALFATVIFKISININLRPSGIYKLCRDFSLKIYLVHMYFIAIYRVFYAVNESVYNYAECFIFALVLSVALSAVIALVEKRWNNRFIKLLF